MPHTTDATTSIFLWTYPADQDDKGGILGFLPLVEMTKVVPQRLSCHADEGGIFKISPAGRNDKSSAITTILSCRRRRHLKIPPAGRNDKHTES